MYGVLGLKIIFSVAKWNVWLFKLGAFYFHVKIDRHMKQTNCLKRELDRSEHDWKSLKNMQRS
ncbi:hypothetical protein H839_06159 [Parageobacillus genomosp. 1]|uniref:Transposase n=1 Tax=Parageobacillus genomosp. 1 TaxID=1295642 RepID=A0ABC9VF87_9BACL|nr:hypothetical protein H839_06159 [Parageobacillus genomosp. 1]